VLPFPTGSGDAFTINAQELGGPELRDPLDGSATQGPRLDGVGGANPELLQGLNEPRATDLRAYASESPLLEFDAALGTTSGGPVRRVGDVLAFIEGTAQHPATGVVDVNLGFAR
jgi:hypothetical protein